MAEPQEARECANAAQAAEWDGPAGAHRTRHAAVFDAETRPHNERFRTAADVAARDRVLDIGCGTGQTTRDAARAAVAGSALGVDLSAQMLDHARRLSREEGLANVSFLQADAQVHPFPAASFEVGISRFGTMFFAEISFTDVREPVYYGPDPAVAFDVVRGLRSTRDLLAGLDAGEADRALDRLRATLAAHQDANGVFFDARSWIIAARRG